MRTTMLVKIRHIYEHDAEQFEARLTELIDGIMDQGGAIDDIKYVSDPATAENSRGGFGALIIYEVPETKEAS